MEARPRTIFDDGSRKIDVASGRPVVTNYMAEEDVEMLGEIYFVNAKRPATTCTWTEWP